MADVVKHGTTHGARRRGASDPLPARGYFQIKLFADRGALDGLLPDTAIVVSDGDNKFRLLIPPSLHGTRLTLAEAGITEAASIDVEVEVINVGNDLSGTTNMLSTAIVIPDGDLISWTPGESVGATAINDANAEVASGDWVQFNVAAGGGDTAESLTVIVEFDY